MIEGMCLDSWGCWALWEVFWHTLAGLGLVFWVLRFGSKGGGRTHSNQKPQP